MTVLLSYLLCADVQDDRGGRGLVVADIVVDRRHADKDMARTVGCDFICVLSDETTRERIDELIEDEFASLIVKDLRPADVNNRTNRPVTVD
jgi:tryptophan synthase alpha subunit